MPRWSRASARSMRLIGTNVVSTGVTMSLLGLLQVDWGYPLRASHVLLVQSHGVVFGVVHPFGR